MGQQAGGVHFFDFCFFEICQRKKGQSGLFDLSFSDEGERRAGQRAGGTAVRRKSRGNLKKSFGMRMYVSLTFLSVMRVKEEQFTERGDVSAF